MQGGAHCITVDRDVNMEEGTYKWCEYVLEEGTYKWFEYVLEEGTYKIM